MAQLSPLLTIGPDSPRGERNTYGQTVLKHQLRDALVRLNPRLPVSALDDTLRNLTQLEGTTLEGTTLEGTTLEGTTLEGTTLEGTTLEGTTLEGTTLEGTTLEARNRSFHRMLVKGVMVEYQGGAGFIRGEQAQVVDFHAPEINIWLVVNQFTVSENRNTRRPDIGLFLW